MKKRVLSLMLASVMALSLAACGAKEAAAPAAAEAEPAATEEAAPAATEEELEPNTDAVEDATATVAAELVDGKFAETRHITVEVYDRGNDGGSDPTNNMYTDYIKKGMLEEHNVEVEFVAVPRWTEVEEINNLLAAGTAPDICVTYDYPTIQTYANMGGVLDLQNYVADESELPNLWNWLTSTNIYWDQDLKEGTLWAIEGKLANSRRIVTFIRQDWLDALSLKEPTNKQEFYDTMCAFRDNAETLLGADAAKLIPFSVSYDVGWRAALLIESEIDPSITDKEYYINGFDDRKLTENGTKEAIRTLNKWYNEGLMWNDFALYGSGDTTEDDMMKAGYVGAFMHNWDYPFRNGEDSIQANLQRLVGENAKYVAIDCFEDANGAYTKYVSSTAGDRKIFFPSTNDEPVASMLYLDWISNPEHIQYLQQGDEGVTHNVLEDGAIEIIAATGNAIQNSGMNIDYTITCNGIHFVDEEITLKSAAHNYANVDSKDVERAINVAENGMKRAKNYKTAPISAEDGMGEALSAKRDIILDTSVSAAVDEFDAVWDEGMEDYLASGGQDIMTEREEAWNAVYSTDNID